jgi:uncharacterized protein YbjT (DUF2867 family)
MTDRGAPDPAAAAGSGLILVTGATGTTGRHLTGLLRERGARVREASRHPRPDAGPDTSVFFDWGDPATYPAALDGISGLYLLRPPRAAQAMPLAERFLAAARAAGVRRIVLLHSMVAGPAGMPQIRQAVEESAPEYAILQPSWFMQNFTGTHPTAIALREHGEIATATGNGRVGFIDARDIAAAAAAALLAPEPPNTRYVLTGPETLSYPQVAAILSEITGRAIRHTDLTAGQLTARWTAAGLPENLATAAADLDIAISRGDYDYTTPDVQDLTGLPPRSFRDFAAEHRDAWPTRAKPRLSPTAPST